MSALFSIKFWVNIFVSTLMTMAMIYVIKRIAKGIKIPIVSDIAQEV